jgi:hypothetical protein
MRSKVYNEIIELDCGDQSETKRINSGKPPIPKRDTKKTVNHNEADGNESKSKSNQKQSDDSNESAPSGSAGYFRERQDYLTSLGVTEVMEYHQKKKSK